MAPCCIEGGYMPRKNPEIKAKIARLIEFNPKLSNIQIATALDVSRQLVHYHVSRIKLPRQSPNRSCLIEGCTKRIGRYNNSGVCREHQPLLYAYDFQCPTCKKVVVVTGRDAANRRNSKKIKKLPDLDYCTISCFQKSLGKT